MAFEAVDPTTPCHQDYKHPTKFKAHKNGYTMMVKTKLKITCGRWEGATTHPTHPDRQQEDNQGSKI
jgi:hypothetical protein